MELTKNFMTAEAEAKWTQIWKEKGYFTSQPDERPAFTVVIPPPNVTGVLHMGHTLNETVQDILVRKARMSGFNACWVPGSDHASIATEAKVVQMLEKEKGIKKADLSREEFLRYAFEWKEKYGGIIYNQIERLGCSVDWNRVSFTMDDHYYKAVIEVFVDLYKKGLIYRGARMINWDPSAKTALSDEEVEYKDIQGKLYHVCYRLEAADGQPLETFAGNGIVIATQRPETIMGDTAICVNPNDERYAHLKGAFAYVPLINRRIPIIFDEYVDTAFGTGALKVTPAHDINDYNLGLKHQLEVVDTLNADGTLSEAAQIHIGVDRFKARKLVVEALRENGQLVKEEEYSTRLGYSQRTGVVVEPRISTQWFVRMKELAEPALNAVVSGDIRIHPGDKFLATYKYWLENVKDWCISRQLWWGQQIPAFYAPDGSFQVAATREEAYQAFVQSNGAVSFSAEELKQDEDVLDTWFSSWLWPIEVFNGITEPGNKEIRYYYPTSVLVTGQDIIFFWVARMVMAGMEYEKQIPFRDVYFTGMVRDKQGRKMSKSLGNSPDLLELIDKYGADAVRFGIMISSPAGNDLLFDEAALEQGRNFNNKMWNALKLITMWKDRESFHPDKQTEQFASMNWPNAWFRSRLNQVRAEVDQLMQQFRLSEALKTIYSLVWDDYCSWYLEWIKPGVDEPVNGWHLQQAISFYEELVQLLHPYMPFITEEIYHLLADRKEGDELCVRQFTPVDALPTAAATKTEESFLAEGELLKQVISGIRDQRNKAQLKPKESIRLFVNTTQTELYNTIQSILLKQVNAASIGYVSEAVPQTIAAVIGKDQFYIESEKPVDTGLQKEDLQKELDYLKGFVASCDKKLTNERFVQNAKPEVVEMEKKKKSRRGSQDRNIGNQFSELNMNYRILKQVVLQLVCWLPVCLYAQAPAIDRSTLVELAEHRRHEPLEFQQLISNTTNWISLGVPAGLLIGGQLSGNKDMKRAAWNVGKTIVISTGITAALKFSVNRNRPFNEYPSDIPKAGAGGSPSFPSGHTSQAFATATALYLEYSKWYVAVPAFGWASAVGYSRMYLGVHYPTDVLAGALVGSGSALLNRQINHWIQKKQHHTEHVVHF